DESAVTIVDKLAAEAGGRDTQKGPPKRALFPSSGRRRLALGELERSACFGAAIFLAFHHPGIASEEAALLEGAAQFRLKIGERLGKAVAHGARLPRQAAAGDGAGDVVLAGAIGRDQ